MKLMSCMNGLFRKTMQSWNQGIASMPVSTTFHMCKSHGSMTYPMFQNACPRLTNGCLGAPHRLFRLLHSLMQTKPKRMY